MIVVYDACVLFPAPLRDLLVRLASAGIVRARLTTLILDECFRSICAQRPDLRPDALERTRTLLLAAMPDSLVSGFEPLIATLRLPDPDDRHVVAAAIKGSARVIVTFNLKDFPANVLRPLRLRAMHPDELVSDLVSSNPSAVAQVVLEQAAALRSPPRSVSELLATLEGNGLIESTARMRAMKNPAASG